MEIAAEDATGARRIVIVGAAAAGLAAAEAARSFGYQGELVMVGAEEHLPYDRPPLSKQLLTGAWEAERLALRAPADLERLGLDLRLGVPAAGLDDTAHEVVLADGARVGYDALVVATGARPRRLPGTDGVRGVHVLRDLADALALRDELRPGARLVVIGAGVLGAEVASVATKLGVAVTLVDPLPLPMARVVGEAVGEMIADLHRDNGVDVRCGVGVRAVHAGNDGAVTSVELTDGSDLPADAVLVAIGASPAVEWLAGSGVPIGGPTPAQGAGGVLCEPGGRACQGVYAAGDVAAWWDASAQIHRRVEHRLNATEQGRAAARSILAVETDEPPMMPYFWSDQYDLRLQSYGLPESGDEFVVVEGSLAERRFVGAYLRDGAVSGVLGSGMHRQLRGWRARVGEQFTPAVVPIP